MKTNTSAGLMIAAALVAAGATVQAKEADLTRLSGALSKLTQGLNGKSDEELHAEAAKAQALYTGETPALEQGEAMPSKGHAGRLDNISGRKPKRTLGAGSPVQAQGVPPSQGRIGASWNDYFDWGDAAGAGLLGAAFGAAIGAIVGACVGGLALLPAVGIAAAAFGALSFLLGGNLHKMGG